MKAQSPSQEVFRTSYIDDEDFIHLIVIEVYRRMIDGVPNIYLGFRDEMGRTEDFIDSSIRVIWIERKLKKHLFKTEFDIENIWLYLSEDCGIELQPSESPRVYRSLDYVSPALLARLLS